MHENLYKRGLAVGKSNIVTDTMTFRFKGELFEFPTMDVIHLARFNGHYYEARVKSLRTLRDKRKHKNGIRRDI